MTDQLQKFGVASPRASIGALVNALSEVDRLKAMDSVQSMGVAMDGGTLGHLNAEGWETTVDVLLNKQQPHEIKTVIRDYEEMLREQTIQHWKADVTE